MKFFNNLERERVMDNYNNQGQNSNYTFNTPVYANNMQNQNNGSKSWIGVVPSVIQWLIYGLDLMILFLMFLSIIAEDEIGAAIGGVLILIMVLHVLEFLIYGVIGVFQIISIKMKKYNKFVVFSLIVNIIVFILGWVDILFMIILVSTMGAH